MQDNKLNSEPLSISFSKSNSNGDTYRGISDSNSSSQTINSIYQPITIISPPHTTKSQHNNNIINHPSKPQPLSKQPFEPLDILITPISIDPPSKINNNNNITAVPFEYCNELNSYLVENVSSHQVLKNLDNILNTKFTDIEFQTNYKNSEINGLIFMQSYNVYFTLYIWSNNSNIQIEFRRTSGDALASSKFWSQIKGYYNQNYITKTEQKEEIFSLISLELPALPPMDIPFNNTQFQTEIQFKTLMESLQTNDLFITDELNILYEEIQENNSICKNILENKLLMKELINALLNKDICVARVVLLILNELVKATNEFIGSELFGNLNVLLNGKQMLIKKYSMGLLSNLGMIKCEWIMNENERKEMIKNIKNYQNECSSTLNYENVFHKLMVN